MKFTGMNRMIRRVVASVKAYFGKQYLIWENFGQFAIVAPFIMTHLHQVYFSLFLMSLSSVVGSLFSKNIGGFITVLGFIGCLIWFRSIPAWRERKRVYLLMAAAFCIGASVEFLLSPFINVNQGFIITVLGGSTLVFGCYALDARRFVRLSDFANGLVFSLITGGIWFYTAVNIFGGECPYPYKLYFYAPYVALLLLVEYTMTYKQVMIEQTRGGNYHYSEHCIMFFTDFPAVLFWYTTFRLRALSEFLGGRTTSPFSRSPFPR